MSIEITPELLEELKEKAKAASSSQDGRSVILWWSEPEIKYSAAANPAVVLALVDEIERLRGQHDLPDGYEIEALGLTQGMGW